MRNYDAWKTREPPWDDLETWEMQKHCPVCGCWLPLQPTSHREESSTETCEGIDPEYGWSHCKEYGSGQSGKCPNTKHTFTMYRGTWVMWDCPHCGATTAELEY